MARILVVEDEVDQADILARSLREERHAVDVVHDGESGLIAAATHTYGLLVLDWMLPDLDGVQLCRRLRRRGSEVAILMLTARDTTEDIVAGLDAGASDYLTKPFDLAELSARVRALLRRPTAATARLVAGPITIDTVEKRAYLSDRPLALTAKEYQLLELLAARPGRILSRRQLEESLWDWDHAPCSNAVEVHLSGLRRKLAVDSGRALIRTTRGVGYRFEIAEDDD